MNPNFLSAARSSQVGDNNFPENAHLRESSAPGQVDNGRIVEAAFKPAKPRFRESSARPPQPVLVPVVVLNLRQDDQFGGPGPRRLDPRHRVLCREGVKACP